jgi:hypothetical protein
VAVVEMVVVAEVSSLVVLRFEDLFFTFAFFVLPEP